MGKDLLDPSFSQSEDPIVGHLGTSTEEKESSTQWKRTPSHLPKNTGSHAQAVTPLLPLLVTDFAFALVEPVFGGLEWNQAFGPSQRACYRESRQQPPS